MRTPHKPTQAEAVAAAFGPSIKPDAKGGFTWTIAKAQVLPWPDNEGTGDVRGRQVQSDILYFEALPPTSTPDGVSGNAPRWLLVTGGPTLQDGQPDDCHACGAILSAFVLTRTPTGSLVREMAAPVLTQSGGFGDPPEVAIVATGPVRQAIRFESGYTGQGITASWQDFYGIGPGFPDLLTRPLAVHGDNEGTCSTPAEIAKDPSLETCKTADTTIRFVPARPGETDDPGQWVLETTTRNPAGMADEGVLPAGVLRLPFRNGKYQAPARPAGT